MSIKATQDYVEKAKEFRRQHLSPENSTSATMPLDSCENPSTSNKQIKDFVDDLGSFQEETRGTSTAREGKRVKRLRYKEIIPRYMFNRSLGLTWYRIFQVILVYWMLMNFAFACTGPVDYGYNHLYPNYCTFVRITCFIIFVICFRLFVCTKRYSFSMLRWTKVLGIAMVLDDLIAIVAQAIDLDIPITTAFMDSVGQIIGACIASCLWAIPTYRYLRKRWLPDEYVSHPSKPVKNDCMSPSIAVSSPIDPLEPAAAIPIDNIESPLVVPVAPDNATIPADDSSPHPIESTGQAIDQQPITSQATNKPLSIRFCRYCGTELRSESKFCDNCGKKVRK